MADIPDSERSAAKKRFIDLLERSIAHHLDEVEHDHPQGLHYRGTDLRPALEKKLFFKHLRRGHQRFDLSSSDRAGFVLDFGFQPNRLAVLKRQWKHAFARLTSGRLKPTTQRPQEQVAVFVSNKKFLPFVQDALSAQRCYTMAYAESEGIDRSLSPYNRHALPPLGNASGYLITHHYDVLRDLEMAHCFLEDQRPKAVLVMEGNSLYDNLVGLAAKSLGIPSVVMQYGWPFISHMGFQRFPYDHYITWGEVFSAARKPWNPSMHYHALGHPAFHTAENSSAGNAISFILQGAIGWIGQDTWKSFIASVRWTCEAFPDTEIWVREHPALPLSPAERAHISLPNCRIVTTADLTLNDQLEASMVTVTIYSSVAFEALAKQSIPVFFLDHMDIAITPDLAREGLAMEARSAAEFREIMQGVMTNATERTAVLQKAKDWTFRLYAATGKEARERIDTFLSDLSSQ